MQEKKTGDNENQLDMLDKTKGTLKIRPDKNNMALHLSPYRLAEILRQNVGVRELDKINDVPRLNLFGTLRGMKYNSLVLSSGQNCKLPRGNSMIKFNILVKVRGTRSIHQKESD